jgi:LPS-assembly protein
VWDELPLMMAAGDPGQPVLRRSVRTAAMSSAALSACVVLAIALADVPRAQTYLTFQSQLRPPKGGSATAKPKDGDQQMLVQADEIQYDYNNELVSAVGNVQIYYNGATIEADKVVYDQRTKRLHAEGNARLTEPDGKITYGDMLDLDENFRNGFVDSLRLETPEETRLAAARADRTGGNYTVFQSGVYTACEPCLEDPRKPPLWQVKAVRIIHDEAEKMMYFENAQIEFFGVPLAWFPYFSAPDPTVKRKSGFLMPVMTTSSAYGFGLETPYYLALAPNYDLTFSPRITTTQGPLLEAEFRERFANGDLIIRGAGIDQLDKDVFVRGNDEGVTPGYRDWRGSIESIGRFALSTQWSWGWDAVGVTDPTFFQDYKIRQLQATSPDPLLNALSAGVTDLYLTGRGDRSFFDIRAIHYYGYSESDIQGTLPLIRPVMDYTYTVDHPVFGGELGFDTNFTSLSRGLASFDPTNMTASNLGVCSIANTADTAQKIPVNCLLRGIPGDYTRGSAEVHWKYQYTDELGQVFTPFASVRGDVASMQIDNQPGVANYITPGDSTLPRAMPTVGLEYRYPFIGIESWGTQTIEPIGQIVARPNETDIGKIPNEDSQSLVFDTTDLFKVDKFAGWDRVEGGGRANAGVQYTAQFNQGGFFNAMFGQSYQLFGLNSFAVGDTTNTGLDSGLDKTISDYVASFSFQPNSVYSLTSRFRFDEETFSVERMEIDARASFDRWTGSILYGDYAAQPELGFINRREGVLSSASYKLTDNWVFTGGVRYDFEVGKVSQTRVGFGYIDDCFTLSLNYFMDNTYSGNVGTSQTVMVQFSLRTLGGFSTQ